MAASTIVWEVPPSVISRGLEKYGDRVLTAILALAQYFGQKMQDEMRRNAKWTDRTGNARSGLFAEAQLNAAQAAVELYLSHGHTVDYGVFLEYAHAGKYAIVLPTIEANISEIQRELKRLLSG